MTLSLCIGTTAKSTPLSTTRYEYRDNGNCNLKKYVDLQWVPFNDPSIFKDKLFYAGGTNSNWVFKFDGNVYSADFSCLPEPPFPDSSKPDPVVEIKKNPKKEENHPWIFQIRGFYSFRGSTPDQQGTTHDSAFIPVVGFDIREYYGWNPKNALFLGLSEMSGTQTATDTTGWKASDNITIWALRLGYQRTIVKKSISPYFSFSGGLARFSKTIALSGNQNGGVVSSSTPFTGQLETGIYIPFGTRLQGIFALSYTYLNSGIQVISESSVSTYEVGGTLASQSYSSFGIHFGLAY